MGVFRIYPSKSNSMASGIYQIFNSGQNAVTDLWYGGGGTDTAPERRNSISRFIVKFDLDELTEKINSKEINGDLIASYKLKMTNAVPGDRILEPEFEFDVLDKRIAASFDLIAFPINKDWDEGRGYDMFQENYLVRQNGNPLATGYSNWNSATMVDDWDEPGVFTNPTANTTTTSYEGSVDYSGLTFSKAGATGSTIYGFNISGGTGFLFNLSSTTVGNDTDVLFNTLSGVTTLDLQNELTGNTNFNTLGIDMNGGDTATTISTDLFYLSATTSSDSGLWATQHFDLGSEDIDMDITDMVNDWLSGGSVNNGIGVAYRNDYETLSTDTRYIASFFTEKTNSSFKPYIEVTYNQSFQDDRLQVSNNRTSRLFLYTFSGNNSVNYYSAGTVDIRTMADVPVYTGLTPTQQENGVYYIDVLMNAATRGQQYKDVWQGVTFVPGIDQQDLTQIFTIKDNYYTNNVPQVNEYSISVYGIGDNSILSIGETTKVFVDLRVNYSSRNEPKTAYDLQYRMVMNNQDEVIPWTPVNQAVINKCKNNYFVLETGWLLHNQTYKIEYRINEFGTKRVMPESTTFRVIRPEGFEQS